MKRKHRGGYDLEVTPVDPFTGKRGETTYHEVKTGDSQLSDVQEEYKRKYKKKYVVDRV